MLRVTAATCNGCNRPLKVPRAALGGALHIRCGRCDHTFDINEATLKPFLQLPSGRIETTFEKAPLPEGLRYLMSIVGQDDPGDETSDSPTLTLVIE